LYTGCWGFDPPPGGGGASPGRRRPGQVDGLLVISLPPLDDEVDRFLAANVPVVLVDTRHPRLPSVVTDDVEGGRMAACHLVELGHRRIAFIGDAPPDGFGFTASARRQQGYRTALSAAGIRLDPALERTGRYGREIAHRLTQELLALSDPPTAIFAASDTQALGVLEAAGLAGRAVPDELSVVGFDDIAVAPYAGLTTVRQPLYTSGARGVARLLGMMAGSPEHAGDEELPLELVVRRTTAPPGRTGGTRG
jgi:LacI family transcriptional regulator